MIDLTPFNQTVWLAEPTRFQQSIAQVRSYARCYTREEILAAHRADLERAKALASDAIPGNGQTDIVEECLSSGVAEGIGDFAGIKFISIPRAITDEEEKRLKDEWTNVSANVGEIKVLPSGTTAKLETSNKAIRAVKGKVGIIPVHGPIQQHMSSALMKAGGTSLDFVSAAFDRLLKDESIGAIVLHMDSPGGESFGLEELGDKIYNARGQKAVYAMVDSLAASAAFWLASSASMVICTPGGLVGSVGVFVMHMDKSKAMDEEGVKVTLISAGKYKTELAPFGPLSDDARANQQKYVDALHEKFVNTLKRNRGTTVDNVRENYGQGRVVMAQDALAVGMIDRLLSFEALISKLTGGDPAAARGSAQASAPAETPKLGTTKPTTEILRLRRELELELEGKS